METDNTQQTTEEQITAIIAKTVPGAVKSAIEDVTRQQAEQAAEQEESTTPEPTLDPATNWLQPHLNPLRQHVDFATAAAVDYSKFYSSKVVVESEDDLDDLPKGVKGILKSEADEVEAEFQKLAKQGRATNRESIHQWLTGKKFQTNPEQVIARVERSKQKKVNRAQQAVDPGGAHSLTNMTIDEIRAMPHEQLTKALENVTF